ncbi:hypothetical protein CRYUN_Cryun05aG0107400 [Craigia yunnanensis]
MAREAKKEKEEVTVCARCHSLRNYGQVKNQSVENLIPDFDFDRLITTRLIKPTGNADRWVRHRAKAGGAPKLNGIYLVSLRKDLGVKNMLAFIKELAGPRGNVWVIGAQNAGKSTLINALAKKEKANITRLTEAPIPETTLGILRIGGILSAKAKMYDTSGLLHPYLCL